MDSIRGLCQKSKAWLEGAILEWGMALVLVLVAGAAFGMGRLSAFETARPAVSVYRAQVDEHPRAMAPGGLIEASAGGATYYYPWCAGAQKITSERARWFASAEAAQEAGYRAAKNCKGLQ